ncbi:MAG: hypothetical protein JWN22_2327 [Nocardioides sp.]|jgi:hypothetical protein|nr:hypothetical protein [Nocardioides sp.]
MPIRAILAAFVVVLAGLTSVPTAAQAAPAHVAHARLTHACTHTSTGTCIRGGQFCPQASYGHSGWDVHGRRWVCKGDHTHPHWLRP